MAYVYPNFRTKAELRRALAAGGMVTVFQAGPFALQPQAGEVSVEGPHFPEPHTWYARVQVESGIVTKLLPG